METFTPILVFLCLFVFELGAGSGQTDGQTDGRTDETRNAACYVASLCSSQRIRNVKRVALFTEGKHCKH